MAKHDRMIVCVIGIYGLSIPCLPLASDNVTVYVTEIHEDLPGSVFKSVDSTGNVSYSAGWPRDTVAIEVVPIEPGPSAARQASSKQRFEKIRQTALELANAREKRRAQREEEEKKRLERLALQRAARPQVYVERVYVGWNPLWWSFHDRSYPGKRPHGLAHHPSPRRGLTRSAPLPSRAFR